MARSERESLERELGAPAPKGFGKLDAAELADLAAAVREAKRVQAAALARAAAGALDHIPWVLRAPVRALFR